MHHFLYPIRDTFLSNAENEVDRNYGLDEMLVLGVKRDFVRIINELKDYSYVNSFVPGAPIQNFVGYLTGSFYGFSGNSVGTIVGTSTRFTSSFFSGSLSGSCVGDENGSPLISNNYNGVLLNFSGSISSVTITGSVSGDLETECFSLFTGYLNQATGNVYGYLTGTDTRTEQNVQTVEQKSINRIFLQWDLDKITSILTSENVTVPKYTLRLTSVNSLELPFSYKIYAFPIKQSWIDGDGYYSDGGSDKGVSWWYRDKYEGTLWYSPLNTNPIVSSPNYLDNYSLAQSESFTRGGGDWWDLPCIQDFSKESSDISLDVTQIIETWIYTPIENNGIVLMFSGETDVSSSNSKLMFFSVDSNTIYSPKLDISWDDSSWITGSIATGSVNITSYSPRITGSISQNNSITGSSITGSVFGNAYFSYNPPEIITSGFIDTYGSGGTVNGIRIYGNVNGGIDTGSGIVNLNILEGGLSGSVVVGYTSASNFIGTITGSFTTETFTNQSISGSDDGILTFVTIGGPFGGTAFGEVQDGTYNSGTFIGKLTSGLLKDSFVTIPFSGDYSYLTSSIAYTSSVEITSSLLQPVSFDEQISIILRGMKKEYSAGDIPRINVFSRQKNNLKSFERAPQQPVHITPKYLPENSFYAIKDNETEEFIVNADEHTKLSCDLSGNYFYLNTHGFPQERSYKIVIHVHGDNGTVYTFDDNNIFKIKR